MYQLLLCIRKSWALFVDSFKNSHTMGGYNFPCYPDKQIEAWRGYLSDFSSMEPSLKPKQCDWILLYAGSRTWPINYKAIWNTQVILQDLLKLYWLFLLFHFESISYLCLCFSNSFYSLILQLKVMLCVSKFYC